MAQYNLDVKHDVPGYHGRWNTAIIDMAEATQWAHDLHTKQVRGQYLTMDGMDAGDVAKALRDGDTSMVALSERYLSAFENMTFNGLKEQTVAAVAGGAVNVGAHLAGTPLSMRRRQRLIQPMGALNIFIDGSGSAGNNSTDLGKRGAALLGLIRMLTAIRPVNLYMACGGDFNEPGTAYGARHICATVFVQINTAAMDLSRDGFAIAHPAFCRAFIFRACKDIPFRKQGQTVPQDSGYLGWELGGIESYRRHGLNAFCKAVDCDPEQSVFFTPMYATDPVLKDPVQWIKDMLIRYGGQSAYQMEN